MTDDPRRPARRGRGALSNGAGRYESEQRRLEDDGWGGLEAPAERLATTLEVDRARRVISRNDSPDVPFAQSLNMYRGCEHGCIYCFARPGHAYLGLSPGLDFETRLFHKPDAAALLRAELAARGYRPQVLALGSSTDPYQPVERRQRLTRAILEVLQACSHPVAIVTKSALVERDLDLLTPMAEHGLVQVFVSVTSLDPQLARRMEPRASAPARRLDAIRRLREAGVPVGALVAPVIAGLNDSELEAILQAVAGAGALDARYITLRLPRELATLFEEWLQQHYPERAARVLAQVRDMHGGSLYRSGFGTRMRGSGVIADLIARRFQLARRRLGLPGMPELDLARFTPPSADRAQLALF